MSDILYVESGYVEAGYFEVIKSPGASTLSASATLDCVATKGFPDQRYVEDGYVEAGYFAVTKGLLEETLSSSFTVLVEDGETLEFDASLSAAFSSTVNIIRIQEFNASLSVVAAASGDVNGTKGFEASLAAVASQTTSGGTIKQASCDAGALFTPTLSAEALKNHTAVIDSQFDLTTTISKFTGNEATLANIVNLSLQGDRSRATDASATSSFSSTSSITKTAGFNADISSTATVVCAPDNEVDAGNLRLENAFSIYINPHIKAESRPATINTDNLNFNTSITPKFSTNSSNGSAGIDRSLSASTTYGLEAEFDMGGYPELSGNYEFAIEFWVYGNGNNVEFFKLEDGGGAYVQLRTISNSTLYFNNNGSTSTASNVLNANAWNHILVAYRAGTGLGFAVYVNGSQEIRTATNSFVLDDVTLTLGYTAIGSTTVTNYLDEFRMLSGASGDILNPYYGIASNLSTSSITVPTSAPVDTQETKILLHLDSSGEQDDYNPPYTTPVKLFYHVDTILSADVGAQFNAQADLDSSATQTTQASVIVDAASDLDSSATLSTDIGLLKDATTDATSTASITVDGQAIRGFDATASAEFTQTAQSSKIHSTAQADLDALYSQLTAVSKIGDFFVNADSAFTQTATAQSTLRTSADLDVSATLTADAIIEVSADSSLSAQFAQTADGARIRFGNSVQTSSFAFTADSAKTTDTDSTLQAQANQSTEAQVIRADSVLATSTVTATVTADRIRSADGTLNANTTVTVVGIKNVEASATPNAEFNAQIDANRIRDVETDFDSIASQLSAVSKIGDFLVTPQVVASLSATANVTTGNVVVMESVSSVSADVGRIRDALSSQSSTATVVAQGISSKDAAGVLASTSTLVATASVTVDFVANIADAADFTITATATRNNELQFDSAFSAVADVEITRGFEALPASNSTLSVGATRVLSGSASLSTEISIAAQGNLLILSDELTYVIPQDIREFQIASETREYQLLNETRTYIVPGG